MKTEKKGFVGLWIPAEAFRDRRLDNTDRVLLGYFGSFGRGKTCRQANATIAAALDMAEKTLEKRLSKLRKLGLLDKVRTFPTMEVWTKRLKMTPPTGGSTPPTGGMAPLQLEGWRPSNWRTKSTSRVPREIPIENSPATPGVGYPENPEASDLENFLEGLGIGDSNISEILRKLDESGWRDPNGRHFPPFPIPGNVYQFAEGLAETMEEACGR